MKLKRSRKKKRSHRKQKHDTSVFSGSSFKPGTRTTHLTKIISLSCWYSGLQIPRYMPQLFLVIFCGEIIQKSHFKCNRVLDILRRSFVLGNSSFIHFFIQFSKSTRTLAGEAGECSNSLQLWFKKNYPGFVEENGRGGL